MLITKNIKDMIKTEATKMVNILDIQETVDRIGNIVAVFGSDFLKEFYRNKLYYLNVSAELAHNREDKSINIHRQVTDLISQILCMTWEELDLSQVKPFGEFMDKMFPELN